MTEKSRVQKWGERPWCSQLLQGCINGILHCASLPIQVMYLIHRLLTIILMYPFGGSSQHGHFRGLYPSFSRCIWLNSLFSQSLQYIRCIVMTVQTQAASLGLCIHPSRDVSGWVLQELIHLMSLCSYLTYHNVSVLWSPGGQCIFHKILRSSQKVLPYLLDNVSVLWSLGLCIHPQFLPSSVMFIFKQS